MNWGKSIVLAYILFFLFIALIVFKAMREDISLVSDHYYDDELKYQSTIEAKKNYNSIDIKPQIDINGNDLSINFNRDIDSAKVYFYKPDDKKQDFSLSIRQRNATYNFSDKSKGLWKIKYTFYSDNSIYYYDTIFTI